MQFAIQKSKCILYCSHPSLKISLWLDPPIYSHVSKKTDCAIFCSLPISVSHHHDHDHQHSDNSDEIRVHSLLFTRYSCLQHQKNYTDRFVVSGSFFTNSSITSTAIIAHILYTKSKKNLFENTIAILPKTDRLNLTSIRKEHNTQERDFLALAKALQSKTLFWFFC